MTTISDKDRAEAQAMFDTLRGGHDTTALNDRSVRRWLAVRDHVLAAHECPSLPVWRPTTREEIRPGWEIRTRRRNGSEATWGIAHHQDGEGDWRTKANAALTYTNLGWTCETTAPLREPWPEELVDAITGTIWPIDRDEDARAVLDLLAARGYLDRAAIAGGEQ